MHVHKCLLQCKLCDAGMKASLSCACEVWALNPKVEEAAGMLLADNIVCTLNHLWCGALLVAALLVAACRQILQLHGQIA